MANVTPKTEGFPSEKELYDKWDAESDTQELGYEGNAFIVIFREFGSKLFDFIIQSGMDNFVKKPYASGLPYADSE